jgi:hypothetical protein
VDGASRSGHHAFAMPEMSPRLVHQGSPIIRLFASDGSERSTYLPQASVIDRLGRPHTGINLMASYYPRQSFWPDRRLFGPDVPHFRHSTCDETDRTRLQDPNEFTDGYYSLDLEQPDPEVVRQMADVRRHGQTVRLTLTADLDTSLRDLERIADRLRPFGPMELRLNHEANGCFWFRFARNVGLMQGEAQRRTYRAISQFFIRVHELFGRIAPDVTLVACYNGPGERIAKGDLRPGELPHLGDDELGLMYRLPNLVVSLDQYGSLHCGWPGHTVTGAPIIRKFAFAEHKGFALNPDQLFDQVFRPFQALISELRGEPTRIDLGELDFDEDFHGPEIRAQLLFECYDWIRRNPDLIGSVTCYEITDRGGLGLFRQREYGNLEDLGTNAVTDLYRHVMTWPEFRHPRRTGEAVTGAAAQLGWRSSEDATGIAISVAGASRVDLGQGYWHQAILVGADGTESFRYGDDPVLDLPPGTVEVVVFAPPPDGRGEHRPLVPVPRCGMIQQCPRGSAT